MLQPHTNIKKLEITRYSGRKFPIWLGDPSFSNMVALKLIGCENCTSLPAVGMLVSLEELTIQRMLVLRSIGSEICQQLRRVGSFILKLSFALQIGNL